MLKETNTTQKETRLSTRATEQDKQILVQAAQTEQWQAFCERVDEPARVIPALRDLFSEPEPMG